MKIHFIDPRTEDEDAEMGICGTLISETEYNFTRLWRETTCIKCLRKHDSFEKFFAESEAHIINQMGEMAAMANT